jgi:hypothetical protein
MGRPGSCEGFIAILACVREHMMNPACSEGDREREGLKERRNNGDALRHRGWVLTDLLLGSTWGGNGVAVVTRGDTADTARGT